MAASRNLPFTDLLEAAVAGCLARYVLPQQSLLIGLSGGLDSVVLLTAIVRLGYPAAAIHVHHGLSPCADDWVEFCQKVCSALDVPLTVQEVEVDRGGAEGIEAAARRVRHQAFADCPSDWLLLAHQRRDRAETLLFNMFRGAGTRGAGAMPERRGRILRPLLGIDRDAIRGYAQRNDLRWIEDESNTDTRFSRNFLRHKVIPVIEERFPAVVARLAGAAERFSEAADLLDQLAEIDLGSASPSFPLDVEVLRRLPEARARNVLRLLLDRSGTGIPSEERLTEALRQFLYAAADRHPAIAIGHRRLRRRRGLVELV